MSDVLLGQSYYLRFDKKLWKAMQPYPPLGTLYAAAHLRRCGYEVAVFDAMLSQSTEKWDEALVADLPTFAVLFEDNFNYLSKMCLRRMRTAALDMITSARRHGCTVAVCGSDAADHPEAYLDGGAHFVLIGEGEETLAELVDYLSGRSSGALSEVRGLAYRGAHGSLVRTPPRPVATQLDALSLPAWDLIDVSRYRDIWMREHGYFSLNLVTSRGCPFHCNWCAKPIWGQRYNARSPEDVVDEMAYLKARFAPDHFWFMDDMMGVKPGWMNHFAELVAARGLRTPFKSLNRVDMLLRDGEIEALRRAGCEIVWTGVESGSQKILDAMDKGIRVEQVREAASRLHAAGIEVGFFLQFGFPGETRTDIELTVDLVRACLPDQIGISVSYPLPGTPFHEMVREQLGAKRNWEHSDDLAMMYRGPFATGFYRRLHAALHKEFRMRLAGRRLRTMLGIRAKRQMAASENRSAAKRTAERLFREAAALLYHGATLPLARLRMERAAHRPHEGIEPLRGRLAPEQAAAPSSQEAIPPPMHAAQP
jgi:anaerobic magnesium-protoporphyrin IX monomethyl ester cyclase